MISGRPSVLNWNEGGGEKRIVVGANENLTAVITNVEAGALLTIVEGKRIIELKRKIGNEAITSEFIYYLYGQFDYTHTDFVKWLHTVTIDELERHRMLYALSERK
jgi:hypothetical protein